MTSDDARLGSATPIRRAFASRLEATRVQRWRISLWDIYVGLFHFVGQEIVYFNRRAVWSLSYAGGLCAGVDGSAIKPVYSFWRQALTAVPDHLPLRGPKIFEREAMRYTFQCDGAPERFAGSEEIFRGPDCLYRLHVARGRLV